MLVAQIGMLGRRWGRPPRECSAFITAGREFPFRFGGQSFFGKLAIVSGLFPRYTIHRMVIAIGLPTVAEFAPFLLRRRRCTSPFDSRCRFGTRIRRHAFA